MACCWWWWDRLCPVLDCLLWVSDNCVWQFLMLELETPVCSKVFGWGESDQDPRTLDHILCWLAASSNCFFRAWKLEKYLVDGNICRCFCCVMNVWHVWGNSNCQSRQIKDGKFDIVSIFADKTSHYFRYIHNEVRHTTIIKYIETKTGTRTTCEGTTPCHWFFSVYFVSNIIIGTLQRAICETDEAGSLQMLEPDFKVSWENLCCLDLNHLSARASSSIPFASHQTPTS